MSNICKNTKAKAILDTCKMTATIADKTEKEMKNWPRNEKFICRISRNGTRRQFSFFQSQAERANKPHISVVIYCLAQDSSGIICGEGSFEVWASEYGYSEDSREAERVYKAVKRNYEKMKALFEKTEILALANMENEDED